MTRRDRFDAFFLSFFQSSSSSLCIMAVRVCFFLFLSFSMKVSFFLRINGCVCIYISWRVSRRFLRVEIREFIVDEVIVNAALSVRLFSCKYRDICISGALGRWFMTRERNREWNSKRLLVVNVNGGNRKIF